MKKTGSGLTVILSLIALLGMPISSSAQTNSEWAMPLILSIDGVTDSLQIGVKANATEAFDPGQDRLAPPPPPVGPEIYIYNAAGIPGFTDHLLHDHRANTTFTHVWEVTVAGASGSNGTLSWNPTLWPMFADFELQHLDTATPPVDMKTQSSFAFTDTDPTRLQITYTARAAIVTIPDTVETYASTIQVPVRISDTTGGGIVAAELSIAYNTRVTTLISPERILINNTLVETGWSIEDNVLAGANGVDTLTIAMSTAQDTLFGEGALLYLNVQTAEIRHPDSTALELIHVLFNDGDPGAIDQSGSLKIVGTDGTITATPDTIIPRQTIAISVQDLDLDLDVGTPDQVTVTIHVATYGDTENVSLTETGASTGIFSGDIPTQFGPLPGSSGDGQITTIAGDSISVVYVDSLDAQGNTIIQTDAIAVIGGTDGQIQASYVIQALDGQHGARDLVRIQIDDTDLDIDSGITNQATATAINLALTETEAISATETNNNTGIFRDSLLTESGSSATDNNDVLTLPTTGLEIDTIYAVYIDTLTTPGGIDTTRAMTYVINLFGDASGDNRVGAFDAAQILAMSVGLRTPSFRDSLVCDLDGNGDILAFDASLVLQYVVRLTDRFPVQTDTVFNPPMDIKNHPFLKPVPLDQVIALGNPQSQTDGTYLLPITLSEREGILSGTFTLGVDSDIDILGVIAAPEYGKFMTAYNNTDEGLKIAFAGSKSNITGSGDVLLLKLRAADDIPIRLSLDQIYLNGQSLTPAVNIEAIEAVEGQAQNPLITQLYQNVPNPFNPQTTIRYDLSQAGQVNVVIYSITGQRIRTLVSEFQNAGSYQLVWDGLDALGHQVGSGIYLMRMTSSSFVQTQKMLLLR